MDSHYVRPLGRGNMHRSYQPLKPVTNRYLQHRWDHEDYQHHRSKVCTALPMVNTKGSKTPTHIQLNLKKQQLHNERLSIIDRDNRLLASKLADIVCSKGLVDHQNQYHVNSLNAEKRRTELHMVSRQNQAIYHRLTSRQSEYRRQLWMDDWQKAQQRREYITRYPQGLADKQKVHRKVKFASEMKTESEISSDSKMSDFN